MERALVVERKEEVGLNRSGNKGGLTLTSQLMSQLPAETGPAFSRPFLRLGASRGGGMAARDWLRF